MAREVVYRELGRAAVTDQQDKHRAPTPCDNCQLSADNLHLKQEVALLKGAIDDLRACIADERARIASGKAICYECEDKAKRK